MKDKKITVWTTEETRNRLKKLTEKCSQGDLIERMIFLAEKIELVKQRKMSAMALLFFLDFSFDAHIEQDIKKYFLGSQENSTSQEDE